MQEMASTKRSEKMESVVIGSQTPSAAAVASWTDNYFLKTKAIVDDFGDTDVTYAIFMRRPVIFAPRIMLAWLNHIAAERTLKITDVIYFLPFNKSLITGSFIVP